MLFLLKTRLPICQHSPLPRREEWWEGMREYELINKGKGPLEKEVEDEERKKTKEEGRDNDDKI